MKAAHLAIGAVALGLGYALWKQSGGGAVATSGTVTLQPRVPYELTLESSETLLDSPMSAELADRQNEVKSEILALSGFDIVFTRTFYGQSLVSYRLTPLFPIPLSIGAQLSATGEWGPKLTLARVERLDGKPL